MPWHLEPMKDAISCEKLRGVANKRRSGDIRMGKPTCCNEQVSMSEYIAHVRGTRGTEPSKYPEEEKETSITQVAASERVRAQT